MFGPVVKGAWLGFCIAVPVGPIGILVLTKSLQFGRWAGLASGFGAALADMTYGFLAAAGVRLAAAHARVIGIVGGVVLLLLAWKSWREKPAADCAAPPQKTLWSSTITTFLLTLSNPMTILSFAAMIASVGVDAPMQFVAGVFAGSMLWWLTLSLAAGSLRHLIEIRSTMLNRLAASSLAAFGVYAIWVKTLG